MSGSGPSWDLSVTTTSRDGVTILAVRGAADVYAIDRLREATKAAVSAGPLVVDLDGCDFLDSTGLGVIFRAHKEAKKAGHAVALVATGMRVLNALRITGLDKVAEVYGSQDEAVAAVREVPVSDPIAELREAAKRMKADAELALRSDLSNKLPWSIVRRQGHPTTVTDAEGWVIATVAHDKAPHVAGMHPGVALAVADWLEFTAKDADENLTLDSPEGPCCAEPAACSGHPEEWGCDRCGDFMNGGGCTCWDSALAVARSVPRTAS